MVDVIDILLSDYRFSTIKEKINQRCLILEFIHKLHMGSASSIDTSLTELQINAENLHLLCSVQQYSQLKILRLDELELDVFEVTPNLSTLEHFSISSNELRKLPTEIHLLTSLVNLDISHNEITNIRRACSLASLTVLRVDNNKIEKIPQQISNLKNLKWGVFEFNKITTLPREICALTQLTELYLNNNQITDVPAEINKLTKLQTLDISSNKLTELPKEIFGIVSLCSLYLHENSIVELNHSFNLLTNLQYLDISDNSIASLHQSVCEMPSLRRIKLVNTPLAKDLRLTFPSKIKVIEHECK